MDDSSIIRQFAADFDEAESGLEVQGTLFDQVSDFVKQAPVPGTEEDDFLQSFRHELANASTSGFELQAGELAAALGSLDFAACEHLAADSPNKSNPDSAEAVDLLAQALKTIDAHEFLQPPSVPRQPQARPRAEVSSRGPDAAARSGSNTKEAPADSTSKPRAPTAFYSAPSAEEGSVGAAASAAGASIDPDQARVRDEESGDEVNFADHVSKRASEVDSGTAVAVAAEPDHHHPLEPLLGLSDLAPAPSAQRGGESDDEDSDVDGGEVGDVTADGVPLGWLPAAARRAPGQGYEPTRQQGESDLSRATPEQLAIHNDVMRKLAASVLGSDAAAEEYLAQQQNLKPPAQGGIEPPMTDASAE